VVVLDSPECELAVVEPSWEVGTFILKNKNVCLSWIFLLYPNRPSLKRESRLVSILKIGTFFTCLVFCVAVLQPDSIFCYSVK